MFSDAELDAREAELDAVIDRIDEVLPQARAKLRQQRAEPDSRTFSLQQMRRTRTAFLAVSQAAAEVQQLPDETAKIRRRRDDDANAAAG